MVGSATADMCQQAALRSSLWCGLTLSTFDVASLPYRRMLASFAGPAGEHLQSRLEATCRAQPLE